mmetsp:Transcript_17931/g.50995  ORF Transcript_17931/g.50995 Transcript_17931/m.50995 type:complete len:211 (-) Transcript_17931:1448-2080(-)
MQAFSVAHSSYITNTDEKHIAGTSCVKLDVTHETHTTAEPPAHALSHSAGPCVAASGAASSGNRPTSNLCAYRRSCLPERSANPALSASSWLSSWRPSHIRRMPWQRESSLTLISYFGSLSRSSPRSPALRTVWVWSCICANVCLTASVSRGRGKWLADMSTFVRWASAGATHRMKRQMDVSSSRTCTSSCAMSAKTLVLTATVKRVILP